VLRLLDEHWNAIEQECCDDYADSPRIYILLVIQDYITYDVGTDKIIDVSVQKYGQIKEMRCVWCDRLLRSWSITYNE